MFGGMEAARCTNDNLLEFLAGHPEWRSPCTKSGVVKAILAAFKGAYEDNVIRKNQLRRRGLKLPPDRPRAALREKDYQRLMASARRCGWPESRSVFRQAVYFLHETGCRPLEMKTARWEDVDWDLGTIELVEHKTARTGESRIIPLVDGLLRLLRWRWRRQGRKGGLIFPNQRGKPRKYFHELFLTHARRAGIAPGRTAGGLRHGFICDGVEKGVNDRAIADVVGHKGTQRIGWYGKNR